MPRGGLGATQGLLHEEAKGEETEEKGKVSEEDEEGEQERTQ